MRKTARLVASGTTLMMALVLAVDGRARADDQGKAVQKDLDELVALLRTDKVDQKKVDVLAKAMKSKYELGEIMAKVYKPVKGHSFGKWDRGVKGRLNALATKRPLSNADIVAERDLLLRAAMNTIAVHEVSRQFVAGPPKRAKGAKEWTKYNDEMKEGTQDLIKAVKANNPAALKKAAGTITKACNDCHTDFR